ncbi:MAG: hypothetical protein ACFFCF_02700 [Promethearchaeota archaeon]
MATINIVNAIYLQLFILLPNLPEWMRFQIWNYLILDTFQVIGIVLMISSAVIVYYEKYWPYGGIIGIWGALSTIQFLSLLLGGLGAFINLCSRPEPKRT